MMADTFVIPQTPKDTFNLDFVLASDPNNVGLCKEAKFSKQPAGYVNCTGFLIAEDLLVTAGHCTTFNMQILENQNRPLCSTFKWVFDYKTPGAISNAQLTDIPSDNVYSCKQVIHGEHLAFMFDHHGNFVPPPNGQHGTDFAIIQLDRKVVGRKPLKLATTEVKSGDRLMVVGYPLALPLKYATGVAVDTHFTDFINTNLDIVGGNSGSPVFNSKNEVVGIAVRSFPYEDLKYDASRNCSTWNSCPVMNKGACVPEEPGQIIGTHVDRIKHVQNILEHL